MDIRSFNRDAWDRQAQSGKNLWTVPVSPELIARARAGDWSIVLTENKPVPHEWFSPMQGLKVLGLACGGRQQGPIMAAAGAEVTIFDNSPAQLAGQMDAGFAIIGMYEDHHNQVKLSESIETYIATRAVKLASKEKP
jgi:phosphoglycerate dehydrogenase-like enzyme